MYCPFLITSVGEENVPIFLLSITRGFVDYAEGFPLPVEAKDRIWYLIVTLPGSSI